MKKILFMLLVLTMAFAMTAGTVLAEEPVGEMGPYIDDTVQLGMVNGIGTSFAVTNSEYLNITLTSTEEVHAMVESVPEMIIIQLEGTGGASATQLTVEGLAPFTTYYRYVDEVHEPDVFTTDATGTYSFTQNLGGSHIIFIQTTHSTLYVRDDATGGDCTAIGTWDAAAKTCTLTTDIADTIQIESDGITLDGNGHTVTTTNSRRGIYSRRHSDLAVRNFNFHGESYGPAIFIWGEWNDLMTNITIENNTLYNGYFTIRYGRGVRIANNSLTDGYIDTWKIVYSEVTGNNSCIAVWWPYNVTVSENVSDGCSLALRIYSPEYLWVENNVFTNGWTGVGTRYGWSVWVHNNIFSNNKYGYLGGTTYASVYDNNFIGNELQISVGYYGSSYRNSYNYWDNYDTPEEGCFDTDANGFCDAPLYLGNSGFTGDVYDLHPRTSQVLPNEPPTANAGADFSSECTSPFGASVTLDGSGSTDPDGDALTYTWTDAGGTVIGTGVNPAVDLALGTYTITLTVDDGNGETASDSVSVTVEDTTPPVITITGIADGSTYDFGLVPVAGSVVTDVCSTSITVDESLTGGDGLGLGDFTFTVTATDESGNTALGTAAYNVTATEAGTTVYIEDLETTGIVPASTAGSLLNMLSNADLGALLNRLEALDNYLHTPANLQQDQIPQEVADTLINAVQFMIDNQ